MKSFPKIRQDGHVIQRSDLDYSFIFSENINDWIGGSARRKHNKRAAVYNKINREKSKNKPS